MTQDSLELPASPESDSGSQPASAPASATPSSSPAAEAAASTTMLVLEAPAPVAPVPATQATEAVPIAAADKAKLDGMVSSYLDAVSSLDPRSEAFADKVRDIGNLGDDDIRDSAAVSNRLLEKPLAAMQNGGLTETSSVSKSLLSLRHQVEDLDPAKQGDLFSRRSCWASSRSAATSFATTSTSTARSQTPHRRDHQGPLPRPGRAPARQRGDRAGEGQPLGGDGPAAPVLVPGAQLDAALTARIAQIEATDPERAKVLKEDMLFSVRQKNQDLLTQLAVSVQGYLALDLIRRNNLELIKGVAPRHDDDGRRRCARRSSSPRRWPTRSSCSTRSRPSTRRPPTSSSRRREMLHQQSGEINEQAASATVELGKLQAAFKNIYATMDEIDTFKVAALDTMQKTVTALSTEIEKSQSYLDRVRANETQGSPIDRLGERG